MLRAPDRILVTGASGFVGRQLLPQLRQAFPQAWLIAADRSGSLAAAPAADAVLALDLEKAAELGPLLAAAKPDAIVHLAAQAAVGAAFADPIQTWRVNLLGTLALAEAVLHHAPDAHFLFVSSAEIYGLAFRDAKAPLTEAAPLLPSNPYAASKAACDLALGEMTLRGLRCTRMRPFNHTGPGQSDSFVVAAFARQIARIESGLQPPVLHVGALDRWRDFLDVGDVCDAYILALQAVDLPNGGVFNIASGQARRVGDILDTLLARSGVAVDVQQDAVHLRPTDVARTQGDAGLAQRILGWRPCRPWPDTLDRVLADWRRRVADGLG